MPNVKVVNMSGVEVGEIALSEKLFGAKDGIVFIRDSVKA